MIDTIKVINLPMQEYSATLQQLRDFTYNRNDQTQDEIWLLQHNPVFTQGQAGKEEHILNKSLIPIVQSDRGGQVTYHGPGQLIIYFLIDLQRKKIGLRHFINNIEHSIVQLLAHFNIKANTNPKAPGIYVNEEKICSLGLRVRHGRTYHGLSLNVDMDLSPFSLINPCGYPGMTMTQISHFKNDITIANTINILLPILSKNLQYTSVQYDKH